MACAQCHHHPYEKWSQDDYWGMAAFFGRVGRKNAPILGVVVQNQNQAPADHLQQGRPAPSSTSAPARSAVMKAARRRAGRQLAAGEDPRQHLVDWMVDAKNPFFARAVANRYWAHFFGQGIVDPLDDMRVTNPPTNPELLDALAKDLVEHKFSLKHLVEGDRARAGPISSAAMPNEFNKHDKQIVSPASIRGACRPRCCIDAVSPGDQQRRPTFAGLPTDKHSPNRAIMLPDESFPSYFLDVFGRPQRISACECERVSEANLAQALHLLTRRRSRTS